MKPIQRRAINSAIFCGAALLTTACGSSPDPQPAQTPQNVPSSTQAAKGERLQLDSSGRRAKNLTSRAAEPEERAPVDVMSKEEAARHDAERAKREAANAPNKAANNAESTAKKEATKAAVDASGTDGKVPSVESTAPSNPGKATSSAKPTKPAAPELAPLGDDHEAELLRCAQVARDAWEAFIAKRSQATYEACYLAFYDAQAHSFYVLQACGGESFDSASEDVQTAASDVSGIGYKLHKTGGFNEKAARIVAAQERNERIQMELTGDQ